MIIMHCTTMSSEICTTFWRKTSKTWSRWQHHKITFSSLEQKKRKKEKFSHFVKLIFVLKLWLNGDETFRKFFDVGGNRPRPSIFRRTKTPEGSE